MKAADQHQESTGGYHYRGVPAIETRRGGGAT
jgi:hypothetical protein